MEPLSLEERVQLALQELLSAYEGGDTLRRMATLEAQAAAIAAAIRDEARSAARAEIASMLGHVLAKGRGGEESMEDVAARLLPLYGAKGGLAPGEDAVRVTRILPRD